MWCIIVNMLHSPDFLMIVIIMSIEPQIHRMWNPQPSPGTATSLNTPSRSK